jgi:hypothetical protein
LALGAWSSLGGCTSRRATNEGTAATSEAIHSAADYDVLFPAVGDISINGGGGFCTGTLIAPDLVLTAAHCFAQLGRGCIDQRAAAAGTTFELSTTGKGGTDFTIIPVDNVVVHPAAFFNATTCAASSPMSCATASEGGLNFESDLAIMHLANAVSVESFAPIRVITDISDPSLAVDQGATSSWVHEYIDQSVDFAATSRVLNFIVGWGNGDTINTARRSGQATFNLDPTHWDQLCGSLWTCNGDIATTPPPCSLDGKASDHQITAIREHRLGPSGAVTSGGDSGGPLLIVGGVQGLTGGGDGFSDVTPTGLPLIIGTCSGGGATFTSPGNPAPSGDLPGDYATTFYGVNGSWIEQIVHDFDGDGVPNEQDNCPTVPNHLQQDTNFDAEQQVDLDTNCSSPPALPGGCVPNPGHLPTASDSPDYAATSTRNTPGTHATGTRRRRQRRCECKILTGGRPRAMSARLTTVRSWAAHNPVSCARPS